MSLSLRKLCITFGVVLIGTPAVWARPQNQDQGQSQSQSQSQTQSQNPTQPQDQSQAPIPAFHPGLDTTGDENNNGEVEPDTMPVAGAQALSLGLSEAHSYWQPGITLISTAASDGLYTHQGWTSYSTLLGNLTLHDVSGRSDLALRYQGGGVVSNDGDIPDSVIQQLSLNESLAFRRATLTFLDRTSYLPESAFGYGGIGAIGTGLQPGLTPNGTILTTQVRQLDNTSIAQLNTKLTPTSSLTLMGGYSLLHFFGNSNLFDSNSAIAQVGYNRDLSRKNSIAVMYRFRAFRFSGSAQAINDNQFHLAFARRVTGRMAFQVQAGPEYATFGLPIVVGSGPQTVPESSRFSWSLISTLDYSLGRATLGLTYNHGISGGAGVFAGSVADTVRASYFRRLSQTVSGTFSLGYARNRVLAIPGVSTPGQAYDNWFGIATVTRQLGHLANVSLSYESRYQESNLAFCAGPTCGKSLFINQVFASFHWMAGPQGF